MGVQEISPILEAIDLHKFFGKKKVLDGVSLNVYPGECLGIFGLRATGKTTLLHMLVGLDRPSAGVVKIMGLDIRKGDRYKALVGLVTQEKSLFQDLTVAENLDFIASLKGAPQGNITSLIDKFYLQDYLQMAVNSVDAGVFQRLALACALLNAPQLLILDEPVKDIDLYSQHLIRRIIQEFLSQGGACIYGFSNMESSKNMHRVGWLDNGRITVYEPAEALQIWDSLIHSYNNIDGEKDE